MAQSPKKVSQISELTNIEKLSDKPSEGPRPVLHPAWVPEGLLLQRGYQKSDEGKKVQQGKKKQKLAQKQYRHHAKPNFRLSEAHLSIIKP